MNNQPKVSVVIPVYNAAPYLAEAIESILAQTYANLELIVLDDGSTDGSVEILRKYGDRFFWRSHKNKGQAATLNDGWSMAQGEYLSYLSADDVFLPEATAASVELLQAQPELALSYVDFELMDHQSKSFRTVRAPKGDMKDLLTKMACPPGPAPFFRKSSFEKIGGWDATFRQLPDYEYWLRLGTTGKFQKIPRVLAKFRVHGESQSFQKTTFEKAEEPIRAIHKFYQLPTASQFTEYQPAAEAAALMLSANWHVRAGRIQPGLQRFFASLKKNPLKLLSPVMWKRMLGALVGRLFYKVFYKVK